MEPRNTRPDDGPATDSPSGAADADMLFQVLHTALCLRIDTVASEVSGEFEARGIRTIVLKGPSVASWLYEDGPVRVYGDADLLIAPEHWHAAGEILQGLGWIRELDELAHPRMASFASEAWERGDDHIDLHCTLWGIEAPPPAVWSVLSGMTEPMHIGGRWLPILAPPARSLHLALHVAQHGDPDCQPGTDLERAIAKLPFSLWEAAAELARRLDAVPGFAAGLRLVPSGVEVAERLGLPSTSSLEASLRNRRAPLALGFEHLAQTRGFGKKLRLAVSEIFPTPAFLRWWWPFASRGLVGLTTAYIWRVVWVTAHAVPGFFAWRRARRDAARPVESSGHAGDSEAGPAIHNHQANPLAAPAGR